MFETFKLEVGVILKAGSLDKEKGTGIRLCYLLSRRTVVDSSDRQV